MLTSLVFMGTWASWQQVPQPRQYEGEFVPPGIVLSRGAHYRPMTQFAVCNGYVSFVCPDKSNENLLLYDRYEFSDRAAKMEPPLYGITVGEGALHMLNVSSNMSQFVAKLPRDMRVSTMSWGGGKSPAFIELTDGTKTSWMLVDVGRRTLTPLDPQPTQTFTEPLFLPEQGLMAIVTQLDSTTRQVTFDLYRYDGTLAQSVKAPSDAANAMQYSVGTVIVYRTRKAPREPAAFDLASGKAVPVPPGPTTSTPPLAIQAPGWRLEDVATWSPGTVRLMPGEPQRGQFTFAELDIGFWHGLVSESGSYACLYGPAGMRIHPIKKLTDKELEAIRENWVKLDALSRAKQIGTSLQIYLADNDGVFPPAKDWQSQLDPYVKNRAMFEGFTYTLNGNDSTKMNPTQDVCGFIETPYGRAVVRADSSTTWVPKGG